MAELHFVAPGDPDQLTGGYAYNRRMVDGLRARGWLVHLHRLPDVFPEPDPGARRDAAGVLAAVPAGANVLVDGLALGALPDLIEAAVRRVRVLALFHQPLAAETGLAPAAGERLAATELRALTATSGIITTSAFSARQLVARGLDGDRVIAVAPGTDPAPLAEGGGAEPLNLLCVGSVTPRKGQDLLVEALAGLRDRAWHCRLVGVLDRAPRFVAELRERIRTHGLGERVLLAGGLPAEDLQRAWHRADLFVLASRYEGFGMVLTEALARGLPIVATAGGAVVETVPADAALIAPPDHADALRLALARVMETDDLRADLAAAARRARIALPDWDAAADRFGAALRRLGAQ